MLSPSSQVLLSGASGFVGKALAASLAGSGIPTRQLVRRIPATPNEIAWRPTAPLGTVALRQMQGSDTIIHLSGANVSAARWSQAYMREMWSSRVDSTRNLATAAASLSVKPKTMLVASAVGIYGDRGDFLLNEESVPGKNFLAELCQAWEEAVEPAIQAGIRVVNMRLGVVMDPTGGALPKMLPAFKLGLAGPLGTGRQWMSWIGLDDAVRAIRYLADHDSLSGPVNLVAPNPVTNFEMTQQLATALHRWVFMRTPTFGLKVLFGQMADETLLASQRAVPAKLAAAGFTFNQPDFAQIIAMLS